MLLPKVQALILDMDGVMWKADTPIGNLPSIFEHIRLHGLKFAFATNNGTRTPEQYVERLAGFGVHVDPWQVVTSSLGVAHLLAQKYPSGGPVFAIGEEGVLDALRKKGFIPLSVEDAHYAQAVIMGIDHQISFEKMLEAALLVRSGIPFYATNPDKTFPTPRGEIPGAGAWISVIVTATGVEPIYAGKPFPYLIDLARERLGTAKNGTLIGGDRLETDIAGGPAAGCPVALVLSGVSSQESGERWRPKVDLIAKDLDALIK
jgi:Predicted sugar phosphatases of the HAD superfamily